MSGTNLHIAWARLFLHAAATTGVTEAVLSPGSRSTPLAIAAAMTPGLRVHVVVDERSAGFFALGQARVTGRPSLLLCTSGTAGAHYLPAVIEAHHSFVPMLVVTADRPWELQDAAAPQTIDQLKLFGFFARHFAELGVPDPSPGALAAVPRIACQAVARSLAPTPGPVHVNARFRKPLEPASAIVAESWQPFVDALMSRGAARVFPPASAPPAAAVAEIAERIACAERGIIVCGPAPLTSPRGRACVLDLARTTGFPLLCEATSQLRFGGDRGGVITCSAFDALLRAPELRALGAPDLILEFGAPPTSSGYAALLARGPRAPRFVVTPHGYNDPNGDAEALVLAEPSDVAAALLALLPEGPRPPSRFAMALARADQDVQSLASRTLDDCAPALSEGTIARAVVAGCPEGSLLVVGNSTPVRDVDAYAPASARPIDVLHQRGASGIDGLVSGAAGAASVSARPVTLLLGDLSLLHDLTGLAQARKACGPLVIVVVQNGGGRIFEQLPIASSPLPSPVEGAFAASIPAALGDHGRGMADANAAGIFERCFVTPEPVDFERVSVAFGVAYARAETQGALDRALAEAWARPSASLVEAVAPTGQGARRIAEIWSGARAALTEGARR
jgi:2-succinyl-5-enolpyruvyl-6-hydroxy-3-cyclohexene-1-carboxylate synthase